ncbi:MAG: ATP-binding protein [Actinomycetota bacterium]|nr:ATP-binding protein [Actinomycetota bacterium]
MTDDQQLALPRDTRSPAYARAWVAEQTADLPRDVVDNALLVVSELVTNAVRHGRADVVLTLETLAGGIRISVSDASDRMPVAPSASPDPDLPDGRGLLIVAATAADWGVRPNHAGPGKTVWADLVRT